MFRIILTLLISGSWGMADTVHLHNGDRLQGDIVKIESGQVHLRLAVVDQVLELPVEKVQYIQRPEQALPVETPEPAAEAAEAPPSMPTNAPELVATVPEAAVEKASPFKLPENWKGRLGFGYSDRDGSVEHREVSANAKLKWKGKKHEAEWHGHYAYHEQEGHKSADRYGGTQKLRHHGEDGFFVQSTTSAEVDNVTKKRTQLSETASLGYSPINNDTLKVTVAPGVKAEVIRDAENEQQEGTAYKASVQQELRWKVNDSVSVGQSVNYNVDPRADENWDVDFKAYVETKVNDDVNLRLNYRRDFLNQTQQADDKESSELGASLVWDF